jgi:DNA-binding MurR/RpiR family transcriptional regulator
MYRDRIRQNYERLSKNQKRIADFLMTSHREAAFMTASQLAKMLSVDVASITRFAQRLEYRGYPELLDEVQAFVKEEMSAGFRPVEGQSEAGRLFLRTLTVERENLERTLAGISVEAAEQAIQILAHARVIYAVGQHTGGYLAAGLAVRLGLLGLKAVVVTGDGVQISLMARDITAEDAVIGFGFTAYASDVAAVLAVARDRRAKTVGVTGSVVSPIARVADVTLICSATSSTHIPSEVAMNAVIEGIFQTLASQRADVYNSQQQAYSTFYQQFTRYVRYPTAPITETMMKHY